MNTFWGEGIHFKLKNTRIHKTAHLHQPPGTINIHLYWHYFNAINQGIFLFNYVSIQSDVNLFPFIQFCAVLVVFDANGQTQYQIHSQRLMIMSRGLYIKTRLEMVCLLLHIQHTYNTYTTSSKMCHNTICILKCWKVSSYEFFLMPFIIKQAS